MKPTLDPTLHGPMLTLQVLFGSTDIAVDADVDSCGVVEEVEKEEGEENCDGLFYCQQVSFMCCSH